MRPAWRGGPVVGGRLALVAVLGALVVGLLAPSPAGLVGVVVVLVVGVVVDLVLAGAPRELIVERADDEVSVRLGETVRVDLLVTNGGPRRVRGMLRDAWPPSCSAGPGSVALDVPTAERRRLTTTLTPSRRGEHAAARVTVRSWGPLGLAARQGSVGGRGAGAGPAGVRVAAAPPVPAGSAARARRATVGAGPGRGHGVRLAAGVRGRRRRALHRLAGVGAVHRGDRGLVVRTWRPERDRHVLVVLDTGRTAAGLVGSGPLAVPRLDASLDAALLLAALASRGGDRVDLLAHDRVARASVFGARDPLPAMTTALSGVEASLVETDMRALVATVLGRASRRSLVVLLTGLDDAALTEGLEPLLGPLLHRHTLLVAGVADPVVTTMAAGRGDAAAVYGAAAGEVALAERREVVARLSRRGVEVLDAPPDELAPALADRYLALKARGRL